MKKIFYDVTENLIIVQYYSERGISMDILDKLLSQYTEELATGKEVDLKKYFDLCPLDKRKEFEALVKTINLYRISSEQLEIKQNVADDLFKKLEAKRVENCSDYKFAANFRKDNLKSEHKEKLNKKLEEIWDKEFGDDSENE